MEVQDGGTGVRTRVDLTGERKLRVRVARVGSQGLPLSSSTQFTSVRTPIRPKLLHLLNGERAVITWLRGAWVKIH